MSDSKNGRTPLQERVPLTAETHLYISLRSDRPAR